MEICYANWVTLIGRKKKETPRFRMYIGLSVLPAYDIEYEIRYIFYNVKNL